MDSEQTYFLKYRDDRGEWRWTFYAANHEPIGVSSEGYRTEAACIRSLTLIRGSANTPVRSR